MKPNDLLSLEDVKLRLATQVSETELIDLLGLDIHMLIDALEEQILESWDDIIEELYE